MQVGISAREDAEEEVPDLLGSLTTEEAVTFSKGDKVKVTEGDLQVSYVTHTICHVTFCMMCYIICYMLHVIYDASLDWICWLRENWERQMTLHRPPTSAGRLSDEAWCICPKP